MSNENEAARAELERLVGGELLERVQSAENALVFVLDDSNAFRYFDDDLVDLCDGGALLELGAEFRPDVFMPSNRVARSVAAARDGQTPEPFLVFARHSDDSSHAWHFAVHPIESPSAELARGVLGVLYRVRERPSVPLAGAALSERLERERLETTQAVAVTMRHEINNALTSLIGNAELILRRADELDAQTASRVREIAHQGRRIQMVLDRLEHLTEIRTTTYYGGVQMIELGEDDEPS